MIKGILLVLAMVFLVACGGSPAEDPATDPVTDPVDLAGRWEAVLFQAWENGEEVEIIHLNYFRNVWAFHADGTGNNVWIERASMQMFSAMYFDWTMDDGYIHFVPHDPESYMLTQFAFHMDGPFTLVLTNDVPEGRGITTLQRIIE